MARAADVSVIIPAYDAERYLAEAVDSVLAQSVGPREVFVVDDGSSDGTATVASTFAAVTVLSAPHLGLGATLNRGIAAAAGGSIAFLDADDLWTPGKLAAQIEALEGAAAPDIVLGAVQQFISPDAPRDFRSRISCPPTPMPGFCAGAMLARRAVFERVGPFDPSLRLGSFIDWFDRAASLGVRTVVLPEIHLLRRLHGGNFSLRESAARSDFARVAKAAIDRRRSR